MKAIELRRAYGKICDIFQPKVAIRDDHSDVFIGQADHIQRLIDGIQTTGAASCVIGERGIGKTSLAWQVMKILRGDQTLMKQNNIELSFELREFSCLWVETEKVHTNIEGLLIALLSRPQEHSTRKDITLVSEYGQIVKEDMADEFMKGILRPDELRTYRQAINDPTDLGVSEFDFILNRLAQKKGVIRGYFRNVLSKVKSRNGGREIIIFIDEFDRLPNKEGFGDLVKTVSDARFVVIGVGDSIEEIVSDHYSAERKFLGSVQILDRFIEADVDSFYSRVEALSAERSGFQLQFSKAFRERAVDYCDGFPYMVQIFGLMAFKRKWESVFRELVRDESEGLKLKGNDLREAMVELVEAAPSRTDRRQKLLDAKGDKNKMPILNHIASLPPGWHDLDKIEEDARDGGFNYRFVGNMGELRDADILKIFGKRVRFSDPLYRVILKLDLEKIKKRDDDD